MNDLRFALRSLAKSPGFTAVAVLTLALGIGSTTAFFSIFRALFLNPLPYVQADRLVHVWSSRAAEFGNGQPVSAPDFLDLRNTARSFREFGAYTSQRSNLGGDQSQSVMGITCTAGVLRALGIPPLYGRWFDEADDAVGAPAVVILSHGLWWRAFGGDRRILGRTIHLNGRETTVVGIMPAGFEFQSPRYRGFEFELWTPLSLQENKRRAQHWLSVVGRLSDGVAVAAADAELKVIGGHLTQAYPDTNRRKPFVAEPLRAVVTQRHATGLWILLGAVSLVLLVSCLNVAGLLLARGSHRAVEFGVRLALGANRRQLLQPLLVESLLLGLLGSAVGSLMAAGSVELLRNLLVVPEARRAAIQIDPAMLLFAAGVGLVAAVVSGALPALAAAQTSVHGAIKEGTGAVSRARRRYLNGLSTAQISVAVVLANSAVLLSACYLKVLADNQGFDTNQILTAEVSLRGDRYATPEKRIQFWEQLTERVRNTPGVRAAGLTTSLPFEGNSRTDFLVDDEPFELSTARPEANRANVSPGYFAAMGLRLREGRIPRPGDAQGPVTGIVVNQTMANRFWPGRSALGRRIRSNDANPVFKTEVVGVVEDVRQQSPDAPPRPEIGFPFTSQGQSYLVIQAEGDAHQLVPVLRAQLAQSDPALALGNVRTMNEVVADNVQTRRFLTLLVNLFMATALLLAAVGIYGTLSYQIARRTREIGVRIALGALHVDVIGLVFRQALPWATIGGTAGLILSFAAGWTFRAMIPGISLFNPLFFVAGATLVTLSILLACWLPTRRATRVNPVEALRAE